LPYFIKNIKKYKEKTIKFQHKKEYKGKNISEIKFKPLSYRELSISLERLLRFNSPFNKLERVHKEILAKHSLNPKITSRNFWDWEFKEINLLFQYIWNESLKNTKENGLNSHGINLYLAFEEMRVFSAAEFLRNLLKSGKISFYKPEKYPVEDFDFCNKCCIKEIEDIFRGAGLINTDFFDNAKGFSKVEKLFIAHKMQFPINIRGVLDILETKPYLSGNIKRLIWLNKLIEQEKLSINDVDLREKLESIYKTACRYRKENSFLNPLEMLVLAEGITEEILLPVFSRFTGADFDKNGIKIISSGGKNQMLKLYRKLSPETNLPILMIFDSDGFEEAESIKNYLRENDDIYIITKGEFEDILPDNLICRAVNLHYRLTGKINLSDIQGAEKKSQVLTNLWKEKGFGEFKKAEFARLIAKNVNEKTSISEDLKNIFELIQRKL